jgi:hypothetical protein
MIEQKGFYQGTVTILLILALAITPLLTSCGSDDDCVPSDNDGSCDIATTVSNNSSTNGTIECTSDFDYFRVNILTSGTLIVYTSGTTDTKGYLKDSNCNDLAEDDDGGTGNNFEIIQSVAVGTYYIAVGGYGSSTGDYILNVSFN